MSKLVIILAGGYGKRMKSDIPKVLHILNGEPMLIKLIKEVIKVKPDKILLVVGIHKELILSELIKWNLGGNIILVEQENPCGTGHAVKCCEEYLPNDSNVLILSGDTPCVSCNTMNIFFNNNNNNVKIGITYLDNPTGYGRIYEENEKFVKIIEEKDCSESKRTINKVNCGIYTFKSELIKKYINQLNNNNNQNEY